MSLINRNYGYSLTDAILMFVIIILSVISTILFNNRHSDLITMFIVTSIITVVQVLVNFFKILDTKMWSVTALITSSITIFVINIMK